MGQVRVYAEKADGSSTKFLAGDGVYHTIVSGGIQITRSFVEISHAAILTLPTTPVILVPAPAAGFRHHLLSAQWESSTIGAAYTNVSGPYSTLQIENGTGYWFSTVWANDNTAVPPLTQVDRVLGGNAVMADFGAPNYFSRNGWTLTTEFGGPGQFDGQPLALTMDNNGAGDLTGGDPANYIRIALLYYANESVFTA